ncbi:MAG: septal ring lytic transglycosylase RlpA family protein [Leptospiraceae bacterium]|nr:septal ring lytic transglycosylase RlpA family protein [Leptospiraceae bacterium]MDW7975777.1 septal ring lytic transglycosylase RlpA family protein [Leptospiraceae bacterium]
MRKGLIVSLFFLSNCISLNINQPPSVIENTYPNKFFSTEKKQPQEEDKTHQTRSHSYKKEINPQDQSEEELFFEELSKQDPYLDKICKKCKPDNQPPGYTNQENEKESTTTSNQNPYIGELPKPIINQQKEEAIVVVSSNTGSATENQAYPTSSSLENFDEEGIASWYGKEFDGRPTASGEIFDSKKLTAAHRSIPLGSTILVQNLENQREVILRVNDRGPFVKNRILDVSEQAAEILGFKHKGLTRVRIKLLQKGNLKDKGEGTTAFFYKTAELGVGASPQNENLISKEKSLQNQIKDIKEAQFYSIQVGVFTDIKNVVRLKEEIESKLPYPVFVFRRGREFVVRVGNFSERHTAEVIKQKLEEAGYYGFIASPE